MNIKNISVLDYPSKYQDKEHILIDVREVEEFDQGHLPGAVNIPLSGFEARYKAEVPDDIVVLLVCRTGSRSMMAAQYLATAGNYANELVNLDGGTMQWARAGQPIEK